MYLLITYNNLGLYYTFATLTPRQIQIQLSSFSFHLSSIGKARLGIGCDNRYVLSTFAENQDQISHHYSLVFHPFFMVHGEVKDLFTFLLEILHADTETDL